MRPSDSNSQVRADHYSAMGNHGGGGGGMEDGFNRTHGMGLQGQNDYTSPNKHLTIEEE